MLTRSRSDHNPMAARLMTDIVVGMRDEDSAYRCDVPKARFTSRWGAAASRRAIPGITPRLGDAPSSAAGHLVQLSHV